MTNQEFIESIRLEGEEWRDVVGYEGRYMVSSFGRIARMNLTYSTNPYGKSQTLHREPQLLKTTPFRSTHYLYVMFRKGGRRHKYSVHRLVATAFIPNPDNLPQIDHIDGDRQNNKRTNLRWCNACQNMSNPITQNRVESGRKSIGFDYRVPIVQLKGNKVIGMYQSIYETREYGYNPSSVNRCVNNKRKSYLGCNWMRLSDYKKLVSMSKNSESI